MHIPMELLIQAFIYGHFVLSPTFVFFLFSNISTGFFLVHLLFHPSIHFRCFNPLSVYSRLCSYVFYLSYIYRLSNPSSIQTSQLFFFIHSSNFSNHPSIHHPSFFHPLIHLSSSFHPSIYLSLLFPPPRWRSRCHGVCRRGTRKGRCI